MARSDANAGFHHLSPGSSCSPPADAFTRANWQYQRAVSTNQRSGSAFTIYTRPTRLSRIALEAAVLIGVVVFILTVIGKAMS